MANISISNLPFTKGSPDEILSFENNDMGIELFIEPLVEEYEVDIEKLLPKLSSKNLSFHCPYKFVNEAVPEDSSIWQKTLGAFKYTVNLCKKYNCSYLVVHTNESILDSNKGEKYAIKNLNTIINLTSKYGITAAVENVGIGFNCIFTIDKYIGLFNKYKSIKSLVDLGHAFANSWDIEKLIYSLKNKIISYHLHDNDGISDLHLPIGEGKFDWNEFFKQYKKYTPDANLVLEYKIGTKKEKIEEGINFLKKFI